MIQNRDIPALIAPKGLDAAILDVNQSLLQGLNWLDRAYGKADKLEEERDGRRVRFPGIYAGGGLKTQYVRMFPDRTLGNFCWVDVDDGYEADWIPGQQSYLTARASWVFWYNIEDVFGVNSDNYTNRNVIDAVMIALRFAKGLEVTNIYERGENIYKGYDINEVKNQFLMRPYQGFRIETELRYLAC